MSRVRSLFLITLVLSALLSPAFGAENKPNVLFLFADDYSYEALGAAGNEGIQTPNLDKLAKSGTRFSHAYNMGSWSPAICIASRTMLMTGRTVWRARDLDAGKGLDAEVQKGNFWPQLMKQAGYATWMTGKWHIKAKADQVFDTVKNVRGGMPKDGNRGYNRPLSPEDNSWSPTDESLGGFWTGGKHWSEATADDAIEFLSQAPSANAPFFLYVAFNAPHDPRQSPQAYLDKYPVDSIKLPSSYQAEYPYAEAMGAGKALRDEKLAPFPRTENAVKVHRREYYAIISHLDAQIGRVLAALEKSGQADNTVIFFSADQGLSVGHHGLFGKQNPYEPATRAPLIMAGKNVPAGKVVAAPVYVQDIMATSLDLAGVQKPQHVEFNSLLPLLNEDQDQKTNAPKRQQPAVYYGYLDKQRAVTWLDHKLILYPEAKKARLYNLKNDPEEKVDLAESGKVSPFMQRLFGRLRQLQKQYGDQLDLTALYPQYISQPRAVKKQEALEPMEDDPKLPRVLIIGDSISIGYTLGVRRLLAGKANVHRIPVNGGPTKNGIANIDKWLGDKPWDVIHFNWGLHDLRHMDDGKRQVEIADYEKNLRTLVARMKQTGVKLIWATTTPVPEGPLTPMRTFGDVKIYNDLAGKVMKENDVAINDLNAYITPELERLQNPRDVHFNTQGSAYLAEKVAKEIATALPAK